MPNVPTPVIRFMLDPNTDSIDKVDLLTLESDQTQKSAKAKMMQRASQMMLEAYVQMYALVVLDEFERAITLQRFIAELRNIYRLAIYTYADATIDDHRAIDRMDARLRKLDLTPAYNYAESYV